MAISNVDINSEQFGNRLGDASAQWFSRGDDERYVSIDELVDAVTRRSRSSVEKLMHLRDIEFTAELGVLKANLPSFGNVKFNNWSFPQLCSRITATSDDPDGDEPAGIPSAFIATLPAELAADTMHHIIHRRAKAGGRSVNSLFYVNEATATVASVTSEKYSRIYDADVARLVQTMMHERGWSVPGCLDWKSGGYHTDTPVTKKTTTLFASDRDIFAAVVDHHNPIEVGKLRSGDPEIVYRGALFRNSEVGNSKLEVKTFLFAAVCANRNFWGVRDMEHVKIRHIGEAAKRFTHEVKPAVDAFMRGDASGIVSGIRAAKEAIILGYDRAASVEERMIGMIKVLSDIRIPEVKAMNMLKLGSMQLGRPPESVWDFAQCITAGAQDEPLHENRVALEERAGVLLARVH